MGLLWPELGPNTPVGSKQPLHMLGNRPGPNPLRIPQSPAALHSILRLPRLSPLLLRP